ncbi:hypothetical protein MATR_31040 [Marivirga tractuosa]|uniref:Uncharacterized protein n=1 Tax=Marivirga tractuosa (strain ATCC 23168 / DSM 4126 / NBRC 15989 / NCIMB 1408 / VKM B-1430 / H-43) TaxID=643867 RepID=E4TU25_MARTH|nr:hypothetical protein [Marivirga tractuosa]ADR23047.1 hypothetical protein Ftrac_3072 [Marivirga tractuosa DSM 4126]BDD16279.1 hypothetical protein MATR_31040 [Marivirga tractuosa]
MNWIPTIPFICLLLSSSIADAQEKELAVDPDLAKNAEKYEVKYKAYRVGSMPRYRFGSFKVVAGKAGWTQTSRLSKIWSTEVKLLSENKSHFNLVNGQGDTARVSTFFYVSTQYEESITLFSSSFINLAIGEDGNFKEEALFTASISLDSVHDEWLLRLNAVENESQYIETYSLLTNGVRKIVLKHIYTDFKKGFFNAPALGYEFWEAGEAIGAVKYFPGKMGYNAVWLRKKISEDEKLLLAAAATTILFLKSTND